MRAIKQTKSVIGLDIGRTSVKAVQVGLHDKGPVLEGCVRLGRLHAGHTLEEAEAERLLTVMERRGLTASRLVLVAPTEALVGGSINVPPAESNVSREKIVEMELCRAHKLSPGRFEMVWWDLPVPASGSRVGQAHALALPHAAVEQTLETLSGYGLCVQRTVPGSLALLAAAQRHPVDPRCLSAVVDLGATRGHLSLMIGGKVIHERALPDFNMQTLCAEAAETLGVEREVATFALGRFGLHDNPEGRAACETTSLLNDALEPLAEEIGMSFAYVSHLYPEAELGHLLLAGGGANLPGLAAGLSGVLELETAVVSPGSLVQGDRFGQECEDPALTAALGAAMCGEVAS